MNGPDDQNRPQVEPLTPREKEILSNIGDGLTNRQIADHLTIAISTVKWYVRQIYNKLGVGSRAEAVARAQDLGFLAADESGKGIKHNLPSPATRFVGREQELAAISELIADPQQRVITIFGPGGIGKTRLAIEAAGQELRSRSRFSDGIFYVSLAPLVSADEIVAALAAALDFQFHDSGGNLRTEDRQILDYLKRKEILLIMDNFEHIIQGRNILSEIVAEAPMVKLLVTSRERLQLRGEQLFPLQGLAMPAPDDIAEEVDSQYAAAQLFLNIAKRSLPDFEILPGDAASLLRICRLVEGMPLGLELAASWAGLMPLSTIADEIEHSLELLSSEHHDAPKRHRSMQASLNVSWRRLNSEQKLGFQELTVFRGGFSREAAVEVAGATLPLLVTLVNRSWLSYYRQKDRYFIHELLRQFGAAKLRMNRSHEREISAKHSAYFCRYLNERERSLYGASQQKVMAQLRDEVDNIQIAWRWASNEADLDLLAMGLNSLGRFYFWEGRSRDGKNACRHARTGLSNWLAGQDAGLAPHKILLSQILAWESAFEYEIAEKEKLLSRSQDILECLDATGLDIRSEQAFVYLQKARAIRFSNYEETLSVASFCLSLYRELGDRHGETEILMILGSTYLYLGASEQAEKLMRNSLDIKLQLGDSEGIARNKLALGLIIRHQGHFEAAEELHRQSLGLARKLGSRPNESKSLAVLSYTLIFAGKFLSAKEAAGQAIAIDQDLGQQTDLGHLNPYIKATIHLGAYEEASILLSESQETTRHKGRQMDNSWTYLFQGMIALVKADLDLAKCYLEQSLAGLQTLGHIYQSVLRAVLSVVLRARGDGKLACNFLKDALRAGIENRSITPVMYCLPGAALIISDSGNHNKAVELYGLAQQFSHLKNSCWFKDVTFQELDSLIASMPPDDAASALAKGKELDLWMAGEELLLELSP